MFYNIKCPECSCNIRVQPWKDGECGECGVKYEWGDDGSEEPEIYFPHEDNKEAANDNIELGKAA